MYKKIFSLLIICCLLMIIPSSDAQLVIGSPAVQDIEVKMNTDGEVNVKHIIKPSNVPQTLILMSNEISNFAATNEMNKEIQIGEAYDPKGEKSIIILPSNQNTIVKYNLKNINIENNLLYYTVAYSEEYSIIFDESIELIFLKDNPIFLDEQNGIIVNNGGWVKIQYYIDTPKTIKEISWEENQFDVEIITESKIEKFNFEQSSASISFEIDGKDQFVTITMPEELLGGPYVVLFNDEKIKHGKIVRDAGIVSLNIKPETAGQVTIIGTTVIPEFSMFIPLIMGFMIILTVPLMRKFTLR